MTVTSKIFKNSSECWFRLRCLKWLIFWKSSWAIEKKILNAQSNLNKIRTWEWLFATWYFLFWVNSIILNDFHYCTWVNNRVSWWSNCWINAQMMITRVQLSCQKGGNKLRVWTMKEKITVLIYSHLSSWGNRKISQKPNTKSVFSTQRTLIDLKPLLGPLNHTQSSPIVLSMSKCSPTIIKHSPSTSKILIKYFNSSRVIRSTWSIFETWLIN